MPRVYPYRDCDNCGGLGIVRTEYTNPETGVTSAEVWECGACQVRNEKCEHEWGEPNNLGNWRCVKCDALKVRLPGDEDEAVSAAGKEE